MIYPGKEEFLRLARQCNVIPIFREIAADIETPISLFKKVAQGPESFLLESVEGGERWGRYSFIGHRPRLVIRARGEEIEVSGQNQPCIRFRAQPFVYLKNLMKGFHAEPLTGLPRFFGGLVGYLSYDMVRFFECLPDAKPDDVGMPDAAFMMPEQVIIYDNLTQTIKVVVNCYVPDHVNQTEAYDQAVKQIEETEKRLHVSMTSQSKPRRTRQTVALAANMDRERFREIVTQAKQYIEQGEAIQVVLSQRFRADLDVEPFEIYRALRRVNPSPYMYYLQFSDGIVVGASPEVLVRLENGRVALRPIAGTRRRGSDAEEDRRL